MIKRLRSRQEKLRRLQAWGRWGRLMGAIRRQWAKEARQQKLEALGRWAYVARKVLAGSSGAENSKAQGSQGGAGLNAIGRWGYLAEVLLKRNAGSPASAMRDWGRNGSRA